MKILLVDADSIIPNLPLMKISTYHKNKGDSIELLKLHLPYYPNRKKKHHHIETCNYDKVYCSVVFEGNFDYIHGDSIIYGGTGCSLKKNLPKEIEACKPDYSIYPDNDTSIGFLSRGCVRDCNFCFVPEKEGYIYQANEIDDILHYDKIRFLDNNILALPNHKEIFKELIDRNIKCSFNEGLDFRLLDDENSALLSKLNYYPTNYIFAFDDIKYLNMLKNKLPLLSWADDWKLKFYIYVHPDMELSDTITRVNFLRDRKILPYIMRDISCWGSKYEKFFIDISAWCNQPNMIKKLDFDSFLEKRHTNNDRIKYSKELYHYEKNK